MAQPAPVGLFQQSIITPSIDRKKLLDTTQAAEFLGLSKLTMNRWRCQGLGPSYVKFGNKIKYKLDDLEAYIASHRVAVSQ